MKAGGLCRRNVLVRNFTNCSPCAAPLRVCVVGSGPAGFYTAHQLIKVVCRAWQGANLGITEVLAVIFTPFGIVCSHGEVFHAMWWPI